MVAAVGDRHRKGQGAPNFGYWVASFEPVWLLGSKILDAQLEFWTMCVWLIQNSKQFQQKLLDAPNSYIAAIICCIHDYKWNSEFSNAHTICYIMTMHIPQTIIAQGLKCAHLAVNTHIRHLSIL